MSLNHPNLPKPSPTRRRLRKFFGTFKRLVWSGPMMVFTGRLSLWHSILIIFAVIPAIAAMLLLTLPGFLFRTPDQNAYYYFARYLSDNPVSLLPMLIAAIATLLALAMPAIPSRALFQRVR